jgi:hypothetical protein
MRILVAQVLLHSNAVKSTAQLDKARVAPVGACRHLTEIRTTSRTYGPGAVQLPSGTGAAIRSRIECEIVGNIGI